MVTVVILSCDRPEWFSLALSSALGQSCPAWVIVADDSMSDDVHRLANEFDDRLTFVKGPRQGQLANLLIALQNVTTPWTVILHDDDVLELGCVERLLDAVGQGETARMAIGDSSNIDAAGNRIASADAIIQRRRSTFRAGDNRLTMDERFAAFLVRGTVSPFLAGLLPTQLLQAWRPDARVGSVLDLALCEQLAQQVDTICYVPEELVRYRIHGTSVASTYADLDPLLFVLDGQLADPTFRSIWPALVTRRSDAIARQARLLTVTNRWREARTLLLQRRPELSIGFFVPSLLLTLPLARTRYGRRIRRANPRLAHRDHSKTR
jgi:glycosyltransferase involved in cell wall biosynthesis